MERVFAENPVYLILAIVGTSLFLLKMLTFLFLGDADGDFGDGDHFDGGDNFSLVSIQSILAFMMGAGWIGLAAKREWNFEDLPALLSAVGFGFLMMGLSSFLTFKIKKFNSDPKIDMKEALGKVGRAYTNIPAKGKGIGQVELTVGGKQQILQASSTEKSINSFDSVKVISVDDSGNLVVEKA